MYIMLLKRNKKKMYIMLLNMRHALSSCLSYLACSSLFGAVGSYISCIVLLLTHAYK